LSDGGIYKSVSLLRRLSAKLRRNMLRVRFLMGLLSLAIILLSMAVYAVRSTRNLSDTVKSITSENYDILKELQNAKLAGNYLLHAVLLAEQGQWVRARTLAQRETGRLQQAVQGYQNNLGTSRYPNQSLRFQDSAYKVVEHAIRFSDPATPKTSIDSLKNTFSVTILEMSNNATDLERRFVDNIAIRAEKSQATADETELYIIIAVILALLGSLYVSWQLVLWILKPIRYLATRIQLISEGNYNQSVPVVSDDELGILAGSFNKMSSMLKLYAEQTSEQIILLQRTIQKTFATFPHPILIMKDNQEVDYRNPAADRFLTALGYKEGESVSDFLSRHMDLQLDTKSDYVPEGLNDALTFRIGSQERHFLPRILHLTDQQDMNQGLAVILDDITSMRLVDGIKSNLISTVSHEIKNPLTTLRMAIHLLIEQNVGKLNDRQEELASMILEESERMLLTLDGLLELARIDHSNQIIHLEMCNVPELLTDVVNENQELAGLRNVDLQLKIDDMMGVIMVDKRVLRHILRNFVSNACKYAIEGQVLVVAEKLESTVRFSVVDQGPGIPVEHHRNLFDKFWRIPGEGNNGTGLGLAIVKQMADSHGGKVGIVSNEYGGTTFWFEISV
jgi:NtrC-family two-component system sensor histidine kinase KinB